MTEIISNELLSEVLGYEVTEIYGIVNNELRYETSDFEIHMRFSPYKCSINIYELAHKCKEWAFTQECKLSSQYVPKGKYTSSWCKVHEWVSEDNKFIVKYNGDTEPEAIFKACQWILDSKDKQ